MSEPTRTALDPSAAHGQQRAWRGNLAAITFGSVGLLMLGLQPILLEQLILAGRLTLDGAGLLAMAEIIAIGVGASLANLVLPLSRLRVTTSVATLLLAIVNAATADAQSSATLYAARVVAGFAGGALVWVATQAIVRFHAPERLAGLFLLLQSCAQAAAAFLLAVGAIPRGGLQGGFLGLAAFTLLPLPLLLWLPRALSAHVSKEHGLPPLTRANLTAALSILFDMAVVGALWTFLETFGREAQLPARPVQLTITSVLLAQVVGALAASWLSPRSGAKRTLVACNLALLLVGGAYLLQPSGNLPWFIGACASFGFLWLYMMPFHVKLSLSADPEGRLAVQVPALQLLGSALGPMTASLFMEGDTHVRPAFVTGTAFAALALVLLLASGLRSAPGRRRSPL